MVVYEERSCLSQGHVTDQDPSNKVLQFAIIAARALSVRNSTPLVAVRALNPKGIATSRQDIAIGLAKADRKDGFLQNMDGDPHWSWKHREMRCFFIAVGTMVIIYLFCTHDLLPSDIKRAFPPI